mmetsp:Transcript_23385/g.59759  ORF Transcript_23385/g.59759 Transcript_23385/m.59759 type:complete len:279 (+) Transcript_23385:415-1251(+)
MRRFGAPGRGASVIPSYLVRRRRREGPQASLQKSARRLAHAIAPNELRRWAATGRAAVAANEGDYATDLAASLRLRAASRASANFACRSVAEPGGLRAGLALDTAGTLGFVGAAALLRSFAAERACAILASMSVDSEAVGLRSLAADMASAILASMLLEGGTTALGLAGARAGVGATTAVAPAVPFRFMAPPSASAIFASMSDFAGSLIAFPRAPGSGAASFLGTSVDHAGNCSSCLKAPLRSAAASSTCRTRLSKSSSSSGGTLSSSSSSAYSSPVH